MARKDDGNPANPRKSARATGRPARARKPKPPASRGARGVGAAESRRDTRPGFGPWADDGLPRGARDRAERIARNASRDATRSSAEAPSERSTAELRVTGRPLGAPKPGPKRPQKGRKESAPAAKRGTRRHRRAPMREPRDEILRLGGRRGPRLYEDLMRAAEAYDAGRERDARRILEGLVQQVPDASSVRELLGLTLYRSGRYQLAARQLEAFHDLTNSVEQYPVLMDCYRALRRYGPLHALWDELAAVSPTPALVTEGRIVLAGSLAERGRLSEAIAMLRKKAAPNKRPRPDQVRLWYALADLEARAGNRAEARELFERVRRYDGSFADVAERLAGL